VDLNGGLLGLPQFAYLMQMKFPICGTGALVVVLSCMSGIGLYGQVPSTGGSQGDASAQRANLASLAQLASKGDVESMLRLADCLRDGDGLHRDVTQAVGWYRKAAEAGDARGMFELASAFGAGRGVPADHKAAFVWYGKAAQGGHGEAMLMLGRSYSFGWGVARNSRAGLAWMTKAAELGVRDAMYELGQAYRAWGGVVRDYERAAGWHRKGLEAGSPDCAIALAGMHLLGEGMNVDEPGGLALLDRAVELGGLDSVRSIALEFEYGGRLPKDVRRSIEWYRRGFEMGGVELAFALGLIFERGEGVAVDHVQAMHWFERGAESCLRSRLQYAHGLWAGRGVRQDRKLAVDLYRSLADLAGSQGGNGLPVPYDVCADAMERIAGAYYVGEGAPKDWALAYAWNNVAAEYGSDSAAITRAVWERSVMRPSIIEEGQRLSREISARLRSVSAARK